MLTSLLVPIVLASVALFFASFLSWMVLPLHFSDWRKLDQEDSLMSALTDIGIPPGNYMFPGWNTPDEMKSAEYQAKYERGPSGIVTVFASTGMGGKLVLTFVYFLTVCFCLAYLTTLALEPGAEFLPVFRFVSTAALLTFLAAMVQHTIWFRNRITGHVIESIAYACIMGAIFAAMWPAA
jgi:hypothetical protein